MEDNLYGQALQFARTHYENFPVVSFLIPAHLRKHVAIIYWFARTADDIADEGNLDAPERLEKLREFESDFNEMLKGNYRSGYESALHDTIISRKLNPEHFTSLLRAFKQDVVKKQYDNYEELLDYCRNSANPVGRLILELHGIKNEESNNYSDKICTALQITNFLQDIKPDYEKGRIYIPTDEIQSFKVTRKMFEEGQMNPDLRRLIEFNVTRTQMLFDEGRNLIKFLKGRLKYEIKWTILGGEAILEKIRKNDYNVFIRPYLTKKDFIILLLNSVR
ncbi:MAG TPA: squalene synthase HpnC [Ignavibacteriaceae bacterium]